MLVHGVCMRSNVCVQRLSMLNNFIQEHAARSAVARGLHGTTSGPGMLCTRSRRWMAFSAAHNRQASGRELLLHVAALHGVAACSHPKAALSQLYQQQHTGQSSMHLLMGGSSAVDGSSNSSTQRQASGAPAAPAVRASTDALRVQQPYTPVAQRQQQSHLLHSLAPCHAGCSSKTTPSWQQQRQQQHWSHVASAPATAQAALGDGGNSVKPQPLRGDSMPVSQPLSAAAAGWGCSNAQQLSAPGQPGGTGSSKPTPSWRHKRAVDMTQEEKRQLLLEKLADAWGTEPPPDLTEGNTRDLRCPECGNGTHDEKAFSVTVSEDAIVWHCFRASCGFSGGVSVLGGPRASPDGGAAAVDAMDAMNEAAKKAHGVFATSSIADAAWQEEQRKALLSRPPPGPLDTKLQPLSPELEEWFAKRGISQDTLQRNGVAMEVRWCPAAERELPHIAFPYTKNGATVNIKYRALEKYFTQTKGGEQLFYGYDDAKGATEVIIVEGEMDKLAVEEALAAAARQQLQHQANQDGNRSPVPPAGVTTPGQQPIWQQLGRLTAVLSVPAGAPSTSSADAGKASSLDRKFRYVHACSDLLNSVQRVILAVDSDGPGVVLADELARRIGREKCWRVTWPTGLHDSLAAATAVIGAGASGDALGAAVQAASATAPAAATPAAEGEGEAAAVGAAAGDPWARKDANEVLMKDGFEVLLRYIDAAEPLPIRGLFRFEEFWPQVYDLYQQGPRGLSWGVSTGWESVDNVYKVVPGELTIVTGLPNSGKSEWLDALAVNLAQREGWCFAMCSMENSVKEHGRKLIEKYTGKPYLEGPWSHGSARMAFDEALDGLIWIDSHFHLIRPPADNMPTIDHVLDLARAAVMRYGIRGLVIDPYNELDHRRPATFSETEHVSMLLTKIKRFAQHYDCHVWFVAHPRTQRGFGTGGGIATLLAPTMYDISGSAHFINKADNGIVVHRPWASGQEGKDKYAVQLLVRKVRNKLAGKIGEALLRYDMATGCYVDDMEQDQP